MPNNEKQFESDIELYLISNLGGWKKATDAGDCTGFQIDATGTSTENYVGKDNTRFIIPKVMNCCLKK